VAAAADGRKQRRPSSPFQKTTTSIVAVPDVRRHAIVLRRRLLIAIAMLAVAFVASVTYARRLRRRMDENDNVHRCRS
jgi:Sec-independent protein secretion pathway component TatC